jgi:hypothetical protein
MNTSGDATSGWQISSSCKAGSSCLMFDGMNDYVATSYTTTLGTSDGISLSMWVKTSTKASNQVAAGFGSTTANWNRIQLDIDTNGNVRFYVRDDNGNTNSYRGTGMDISDGAWHHIAGSWDGSSDNATLYIDGVCRGSDSANALGAITISHELAIGALNNNGAESEFFTGAIDEVMLFNRALSEDEVKSLYETSANKLYSSGTKSITARTYASLVLSNPAGQTQFDDIKVTRAGNREISFVLPYSKVDINGSLRLQKGEHLIEIAHRGTNTTVGKPILEITAS